MGVEEMPWMGVEKMPWMGVDKNAVDGRGNTVDWLRMPWMDEMPWMDGRGFWGLGL